MSSWIAVWPPTLASASGTACTAARIRSTVDTAASESAGSSSTACDHAPGRPWWPAGRTPRDTPVDLGRVERPRRPRCSSAMITAGEPEPPGKCRDSTSWPRAGVHLGQEQVGLRGAARLELRQERGADEQHERRDDPDDPRPRRRPAARPGPTGRRARAAAEPYVGRNGQNAARPSSASTAGRNVSDASSAPRDADRGDRAEPLVGVAGRRTAGTAGRGSPCRPTRRSARPWRATRPATAANRSSVSRSSSRNRDTSSSA